MGLEPDGLPSPHPGGSLLAGEPCGFACGVS